MGYHRDDVVNKLEPGWEYATAFSRKDTEVEEMSTGEVNGMGCDQTARPSPRAGK